MQGTLKLKYEEILLLLRSQVSQFALQGNFATTWKSLDKRFGNVCAGHYVEMRGVRSTGDCWNVTVPKQLLDDVVLEMDEIT